MNCPHRSPELPPCQECQRFRDRAVDVALCNVEATALIAAQLTTRRYKCDHCGREADVLEGDPSLGAAGPHVCNDPIDRAAWTAVAPRRSHVGVRNDGVAICLGTMHPIEEFSG